MVLNLALFGSTGKMGKQLSALIADDPRFCLTDPEQCAVLIDFSHPSVTLAHLQTACALKKPLVLGTTGLDEATQRELQKAAEKIPLFYSPNFAHGIHLCLETVNRFTSALGDTCAISIVETHHIHKKDAPSGTALRLAEAANGRASITSERMGDVVGEHRILFSTPHESIEITHKAHSRILFALGALKAADFLASQPPGFYTELGPKLGI